MSEPITWADIEPAYDHLTAALGNLDTILKRRADLSEREAFRAGFIALNHGVESALNRLTLLRNEHIDDSEPAESLEAVLAEIQAEGHGLWGIQTYGLEPIWYCSSRRHDMGHNDSGRNERDEAEGDSPLAAAKARRNQIRKLHAEKAPTIRHYVREVPAEGEPFATAVCGTGCDETTATGDPAAANCPTCREIIAGALVVGLDGLDAEFLSQAPAGPEEVDGEHDPGVGRRFLPVFARVEYDETQPGPFVVGRVDSDASPWWVIDRRDAANPREAGSFETREEAEGERDRRNGEATVAREDAAREAGASEEGR